MTSELEQELDRQVDESLDAQGVPVEADDEERKKIMDALNKHRHDFDTATQGLGKIPNTQPYSQFTALEDAEIILDAIKAGVKWEGSVPGWTYPTGSGLREDE